MKKIIILLLILSVGVFSFNLCEKKTNPARSVECALTSTSTSSFEENFNNCAVYSNLEESFCKNAKSAYVTDGAGKSVVFSKNENQRLTIASMTKIMLLNFVFEAIEDGKLSVDEEMEVSSRASSMGGSQVFLQAGGRYKVGDLIKCVIVASANDASVALSERLFGSEEALVDAMNSRKSDWGLENTLFSNCTGLPKATQYSSAKDVAIMFSHLITHDGYFDYSNIFLDELVHPDGSKTMLTNTNKLVRFYNGCDGGKTGFTNESMYCLVASAKKNDTRLIAVVIGEPSSKERFSDVTELFDYGFSSYQSRKILVCGDELSKKVEVKNGVIKNLPITVERSYLSFEKKGESSNYSYELLPFENLRAPINKGDVVGEVIIYKDNVEVDKISATALIDVRKKSFFDAVKEVLSGWSI